MLSSFFSRISIILLCCIGGAEFSAVAQNLPHYLFNGSDPGRDAWVEKQLTGMSLEDEIGQLLMPIIRPSSQNVDIAAAERLVREQRIGGILYQKGRLAEQYTMNNRLRAVAKIPLLITLDGEYGLWMRLKDAPRYPRNMALGHIKDKRFLYQYGRDVARQCRLMGIHCNFAPDADVNNNPDNPVIGTRSFGEDPRIVADNVLIYSAALEDGGILSVAKHFPGHGNTDKDSHKTLPTISGSRTEITNTELVPFRRYIDAGFGGIMVGHLRVPAFDPAGSFPASLSPAIIRDLLIKNLGFQGLIFTDAMEMGGMQLKDGLPLSVSALLAGNDILLGVPDVPQAVAEINAAIKSGILKREYIREQCRKILAYKYRLIVQPGPRPGMHPQEAANAVNDKAMRDFCRRLWLESIRVTAGGNLLPLREHAKVAALQVGISDADAFTSELSRHGITDHFFYPVPDKNREKSLLLSLEGYDLVIIGIYKERPAPYALIEKLATRKPVALCYFTTPYAARDLPVAERMAIIKLNAFEGCNQAREAAAIRLCEPLPKVTTALFRDVNDFDKAAERCTLPTDPDNRIPGTGATTPAGLPKSAERHTPPPTERSKQLRKVIDSIASDGLRHGAYPGCRVMVLYKGRIALDASYGRLSDKMEDGNVNTATIYDLASVTKAAATTPAVMLLVAQGKINLAQPVGSYLPITEKSSLGQVSIRDLLLHRSGLPPSINFYTDLIAPDSYTPPLITFRPRKGYIETAPRTWCYPNFRFLPNLVSNQPSPSFPLTMAKGIYISAGFKKMMTARIISAPLSLKTYKYSDLNFLILQQVIEHVSGTTLDVFLTKQLYNPIGSHLLFNPLRHGISPTSIAPTQDDHFLRKQLIRGYVNDETAACLGGVAGNAGLFGTANDLMQLLRLYAQEGRIGDRELIPRKVFRKFINTTDPGGRRYLGFDKPHPGSRSYIAPSASPATYGHTGFTGTCFWIDPQSDLIFIFLSNRTYPSRLNQEINNLNIRVKLQQACYDILVHK